MGFLAGDYTPQSLRREASGIWQAAVAELESFSPCSRARRALAVQIGHVRAALVPGNARRRGAELANLCSTATISEGLLASESS